MLRFIYIEGKTKNHSGFQWATNEWKFREYLEKFQRCLPCFVFLPVTYLVHFLEAVYWARWSHLHFCTYIVSWCLRVKHYSLPPSLSLNQIAVPCQLKLQTTSSSWSWRLGGYLDDSVLFSYISYAKFGKQPMILWFHLVKTAYSTPDLYILH